jgi:lipoprotein-releasing system permease protein
MKPSGPGFEWFVAWRHLRDPERRSHRTLIVGIVVFALGAAGIAAAYLLERRLSTPPGFLQARPPVWVEYLLTAGTVVAVLGGLITYLGILFSSFTVFTAISIFGVFLGTAAPIVVLSVMSGFEADLKGKIRGSKADVVITRKDDRAFTEWREVRGKIAGVPGVLASTPYLESELMMNAAGTAAAVVMRGIDPDTAGGVLDLGKTLREGKIEYLAHPERVKSPIPPARQRIFEDAEKDEDDEAARDEGKDPQESEGPAATGRPGGAVPVDRLREVKSELEAELRAANDPPLPSIILGEELYSRSLRVFLGSEVDVVCPNCELGPTGLHPRMQPFRVAGHFYSGMFEYDSKLAYVSLEAFQRFLHMPGEITGIDVRTIRPEKATEVTAAIARLLGPDYDVRSWEELNKGLFMALKLEKIAMFIVLTFIALVASFSIVSNLIMLVTEKGREVAILKAMGSSDGAILRVFIAEGLYIGLLGLAVGVGVGVATCLSIDRFGLPLPTDVYYISKLPVVMRVGEIGTVAALALLLCGLATLYPAVMASRMRPVEGLRYE